MAVFFWSSCRLLPGYPLLEARLNATSAANVPWSEGMNPEHHSLRTLGWLQRAGLKRPEVHTLTADCRAPLNDDTRDALVIWFEMLWEKVESEVSSDDWAEFRRLCDPSSPDLILNLPDYYAFLTYSLFYGTVAD